MALSLLIAIFLPSVPLVIHIIVICWAPDLVLSHFDSDSDG